LSPIIFTMAEFAVVHTSDTFDFFLDLVFLNNTTG
jgi:hypothetical protein